MAWEGCRALMRIVRRVGERFLRIEGVLHNERSDHRMRLHVGLDVAADASLAGAPFELVERPLVGEGSSIEAASPTWPARGVVMAGSTAVLHEGVFEYEITGAPAIAVTLLRCVGRISAETLATRPFEAGPRTPTPEAQMPGETVFSLGVWPGARREDLLATWERFALPIAEAPASGGGEYPSSGAFARIEGDAQLSGIRRHDGRREVRLWNANPRREIAVRVAGVTHGLGPARIETFPID